MKVRSSLSLDCSACKFVKRKNKLRVICVIAKHKKRQK